VREINALKGQMFMAGGVIGFAGADWAIIPPRGGRCFALENDDEPARGNEPFRRLIVLMPMEVETHWKSKALKGISLMRRNVSLAILATVSALTVVGSMSPAAAEPMQDSFCLQGRQWGYPGNCQFSSYAQCMASASGTNASCGVNPMRAFDQQRRGGYQGRY
jgi:hypothetical protein